MRRIEPIGSPSEKSSSNSVTTTRLAKCTRTDLSNTLRLRDACCDTGLPRARAGRSLPLQERKRESAELRRRARRRYAGSDISVRIADGSVSGQMQRRALALVLEWWHLHRTELLEDWQLAQAGQSLKKIDPLD
ncbi:MAG TPA: DUF4160 domain-containing protein [Thermoanaerobaculia bacterium]|nr:DUF4160 domain-containing protein [Thermoanaerobaculia bacterium]